MQRVKVKIARQRSDIPQLAQSLQAATEHESFAPRDTGEDFLERDTTVRTVGNDGVMDLSEFKLQEFVVVAGTMELLQTCASVLKPLLLDQPAGRLLEEPNATSHEQGWDNLEAQGKSPLEIAVDMGATVADPLGENEPPGQHPLQQT